jgi:hypothetical protein
MSTNQAELCGRLSDPSLASVIFAPRPENYTLSSTSVTTQVRLGDAIVFESLVEQDPLVTRRVLENLRRAGRDLQVLASEYMRGFLETSFTTATMEHPSEVMPAELERVPGRKFPFASHLNLLGSPVEGLSFDLDEFSED